jgi:hypothetical protein
MSTFLSLIILICVFFIIRWFGLAKIYWSFQSFQTTNIFLGWILCIDILMSISLISVCSLLFLSASFWFILFLFFEKLQVHN